MDWIDCNMNRTSLATPSSETRDRVADYREEYDEAINSLLDQVDI